MLKKLFLLFILFSVSVNAHLDAGIDKEVGDFIVDFGYSPEVPVKGELTSLVFNLLDKNRDPVEFTDGWVRISKGDKVMFSGIFVSEPSVAFTYTFPDSGEYEISTRFMNSDEFIARTDFEIMVEGDSKLIYLLIVPILTILILIGILIIRKKN